MGLLNNFFQNHCFKMKDTSNLFRKSACLLSSNNNFVLESIGIGNKFSFSKRLLSDNHNPKMPNGNTGEGSLDTVWKHKSALVTSSDHHSGDGNIKNDNFYSSNKFLKFDISPRKQLVDEPLQITVSHLHKYERISIVAEVSEQGFNYGSIGHFIANSFGIVDPKFCHSVSGTYIGIDSMGLISSIEAKPCQREGLRLFKKDVNTPLTVHFSIYKGFVEQSDIFTKLKSKEPIQTLSVERWYKASGVQRIPVKLGKIRGVLFLPEGKGPFPGLIDLYGTAGGLFEYRAALLASRGFVSLALAYFAYDDLPRHLHTVDLDYFEEAINFLNDHPLVDSRNGIGAIGLSKGAEIACTMAEFFSKVSAVVSINGNIYNTLNPLVYKGQTLRPGSEMVTENVKFNGNVMNIRDCWVKPPTNEQDYLIHIEKSNAKFLIIASENDECINPLASYNIYQQLQKSEKSGNGTFLYLPGAGHLVDPPFSSLNNVCYNRMTNCLLAFGGEKMLHSAGQVQAWNSILEFFKNNLISPPIDMKSKL